MLSLKREITNLFPSAVRREWLVTNGLGGWASGTVSGANTRRYHGLFVPALQPPLGRTVLVSKLNERLTLGGQTFLLSSNEYGDGTVDPQGFQYIEEFHLDGLIPVWTFALADALLEKRVWMAHERNTTYITYTLKRAAHPVALDIWAMVTNRDAHVETNGRGDWEIAVTPTANGAALAINHVEFSLIGEHASFVPVNDWHWNIKHRVETERGLPDREDQYAAGKFIAQLSPGETFALIATQEPNPALDWKAALKAEQARATEIIAHSGLKPEPAWVRQLVLAADQFLVRRGAGMTVIAGYPWFSDWGRDTMIALPGLTLTTKRYAIAADILRTFARFVSEGMLPNRFPDEGEQPEYNTVDATLWYFHALDRYVDASGDEALARELFPILEDIIAWHLRGTRYAIKVDAADGLLYAGEAGVQLTWMDVKIKDWVVTPRIGKPVEINALWINALRVMACFADQLTLTPQQPYATLAEQATQSFEKFWCAEKQYLYDVLDGQTGHDDTLRPNQLIALALPHGPWAERPGDERVRAVVDVCVTELVTSCGLRSLSARHPDYHGAYTGDQPTRDQAYHQGTIWAWLIGPFIEAHLLAYGDAPLARSFLAPFENHLADFGLGTIAEVFEGNAPFMPKGCAAQAWSVAEVLRAWGVVSQMKKKKTKHGPQLE